MTTRPLTLATLNRDLSAAYVVRGKHYADEGLVSDLRYFSDEKRYTAAVQGSRPEPYRVEAQLVKGAHGPTIYGLCTCPVRVNCKHVAAMLWMALDSKLEEKNAEKSERVAPAQKPRPAQPPAVPIDLSLWLEGAQRIAQPDGMRAKAAVDSPQCLLYVIDAGARSTPSGLSLKLVSARRRKSGGYGGPTRWSNVRQALTAPPRFVSGEDQLILRMLLIAGDSALGGEFRLQGESGAKILRAVLATGRCHWAKTETLPLREGPTRRGRATWAISDSGRQRITVETEPGAKVILPLSPPWYLDANSCECGAVDTGLSAAVVEMLVQAPEIAPEHAAIAREALSNAPGVANMPLPIVPEQVDLRDIAPMPCLRMLTMQVFEGFRGRYRGRDEYLDVAALTFDYAGARAGRDSPGMLTRFSDGKVLRIKRDHVLEKQAHAALADAGFIKVMNAARFYPDPHKHDYTLAGEPAWLDFVVRRLPQLRVWGWRIDFDESFRHAMVEAGDWRAEVRESGRDWFDLSLQVEVEGNQVDVIPLLLTVIRERPELLSGAKGQTAAADGHLFVRLESGRMLPVPLARLQPLVAVLHDLLDAAPAGKLRLPRLDALRLADLEDSIALRWQGGEALRVLGRKLSGFTAIAPVTAPASFGAHLRPYQEQGLAWLQFLRDYSLGGILADDMGLGKTVQTLAHILIEKMAGRLTRDPKLEGRGGTLRSAVARSCLARCQAQGGLWRDGRIGPGAHDLCAAAARRTSAARSAIPPCRTR